MNIRQIPRASIDLATSMARVPVELAGRLVGRHDDVTWAPVLALDAVDAAVSETVGSLVGDEELERRGRLERARLAEVREAVRLEGRADLERTEAERAFERRRANAERRKQRVESRAGQLEAQVDQQRRRDTDAIRDRAQRRERQAERESSAVQDAIAQQERAARVGEIAEERQAVATATRASRAKRKVTRTDQQIRATRSSRTN